mgnify:CR=1 FL=1
MRRKGAGGRALEGRRGRAGDGGKTGKGKAAAEGTGREREEKWGGYFNAPSVTLTLTRAREREAKEARRSESHGRAGEKYAPPGQKEREAKEARQRGERGQAERKPMQSWRETCVTELVRKPSKKQFSNA